ncbi:hypothetical protein ACH4E9_29085 [Streptomyces anulatus]
MRRATTPAAATVALRGLLVLLVAAVGLLCLLGRARHRTPASRAPDGVGRRGHTFPLRHDSPPLHASGESP